jgi:ATP-dependent DNA ligase
MEKFGPIWLMQPIPYFGERIKKSDWLVEPKIDGWRMQIISDENGSIQFWGRRLEKKPNWTKKLSNLSKQLEKVLPPGTLVDAELCAKGGRRAIPSVLAKKRKARPIIYVFDLVYYNQKFLGNQALKQRKTQLKKLSWPYPFEVITGKPFRDLNKELNSALQKGFEGIIIKRKDSKYRIGTKCPESTEYWRKIK